MSATSEMLSPESISEERTPLQFGQRTAAIQRQSSPIKINKPAPIFAAKFQEVTARSKGENLWNFILSSSPEIRGKMTEARHLSNSHKNSSSSKKSDNSGS